MSKAICLVLFAVCSSHLFAQVPSVHPTILGVSVNLLNYNTQTPMPSFKTAIPSLGVSYVKGVSSRIDLRVSLYAEFRQSELKGSIESPQFLQTRSDVSGRYRPLNSLKSVQPYLLAGIGIAQYKNELTPYAPIGLGLEVRNGGMYVSLEGSYQAGFSPGQNHYAFGLTVAGIIAKPKRANQKAFRSMEKAKAIPLDRDNDGTVDSLDRCPDVPGHPSLHGCPDSDGDGIADAEDRCPTVFGYARYGGCPFSDRDRDGVPDSVDKCPEVAGLRKYGGCPVPDSDGHGINDEDDKCVSVSGPASNKGCPVVTVQLKTQLSLAASKITFVSGSDVLLPGSLPVLDSLSSLLRQNQTLRIKIEGHTDNVGKESDNQRLSERRAEAVVAYLMKKGVDPIRLLSKGFGQSVPVASNQADEGRARNRRVEIAAVDR